MPKWVHSTLALGDKACGENHMSEIRECLEGELLGDGYLRIRKNYVNAIFQLQTKYVGQALFAMASMHKLGGVLREVVRKPGKFNKKPYIMQCWESHAQAWLTFEFKRWYIAGRKIVPADFVLTRTSALHWYVGDGSLHRGNPRIVLCTDGFDEVSVRRLLRQLEFQGFHPRRRLSTKRKPRIELGVGDVDSWLSWIGPCPVFELQHKWDVTFREKRNRYLPALDRYSVRNLHDKGCTCAEIATRLGRSYHTIYSVLHERRNHAAMGS